ncbi:MAG: hypothetical protein ACR2QE_21330 [Acidimicrobiales bacterium]
MSDNWSAPPTSSLPQPPKPPPPDNRRGQIVVGAAVAVLLAIAVGLTVGLLRDDNGPIRVDGQATAPAPAGGVAGGTDDGATDAEPSDDGTDSDPDDSAPPTTTEGNSTDEGDDGATDAEAELAAILPALIEFVETARGLEFKETPVVLTLEDDAFVARFNELVESDLAESQDDLARFTGIYQALGILEEGVTLEDASKAFGEAGVIGYYDPETAELVVRGGELTPLVRTTIVHELVHALDDQWFDLDRPEYDDRDDEIGFGFRAVVEGNARYIESLYRETLSADEIRDEEEEGLALGNDIDFSVLTFPYLELQFAPYEFGELLVDELWDESQATVDAALESPPDTSEKVMVAGAYRAGEDRLEVTAPPAEGEVIEQGVFGQLLIQVLLSTAVGDDAGEAAAGWSGDWFVAWLDGDDTCVRVDVAMDNSDERDELAEQVDEWVDDQDDASSESIGDGVVRLTTCG